MCAVVAMFLCSGKANSSQRQGVGGRCLAAAGLYNIWACLINAEGRKGISWGSGMDSGEMDRV